MALRIFIVTFALLIDGFEILIEMAMTAIGSVGAGTVLGASAGAATCANIGITNTSTCAWIGGLAGGIIGFFANWVGAGEIAGALLGYILDLCITFSFGVVLVVFLMYAGRLRWGYTGLVFLGKMIPLLGLFPGWTVYAWNATKAKKDTSAANTNVLQTSNALAA